MPLAPEPDDDDYVVLVAGDETGFMATGSPGDDSGIKVRSTLRIDHNRPNAPKTDLQVLCDTSAGAFRKTMSNMLSLFPMSSLVLTVVFSALSVPISIAVANSIMMGGGYQNVHPLIYGVVGGLAVLLYFASFWYAKSHASVGLLKKLIYLPLSAIMSIVGGASLAYSINKLTPLSFLLFFAASAAVQFIAVYFAWSGAKNILCRAAVQEA